MKKVKFVLALLFMAICLTSCSAYQNMSEKEAYEFGYGIGSAVRSLLSY